jgi:hypothetical protein
VDAGVTGAELEFRGFFAAEDGRSAVRLPAKQRAVLVLRYHQDLPEAEVARLLRLPLGTVKSLAHRALVRLRTELGSPAMEESRRWRTCSSSGSGRPSTR